MIESGMSITDMAKAQGLSYAVTVADMRAKGIRVRPIRAAHTRAKLVALLAQGATGRDVAKALGVSVRAAFAAVERNGLHFRSGRGNFTPKPKQADPAMAMLTPREREDIQVLRIKGRMTKAEAFRSIGRADLIEARP